MNKYLKYYYIDSLLIIIAIVLTYCLDISAQDYWEMYGEGFVFLLLYIFIIASAVLLIFNLAFHFSKKYKFEETNLLFPKLYIIFFILLLILGIIYNQFALIKGLHIMYYLKFAIVGYTMLSLYTLISFKKKKNK